MNNNNTYDYIIVGAGAAGCVLANRLSENPSNTVLLLEVGSKDSNLLFNIPAGFFALMKMGKGNWNFETTPQAGLNGRVAYFPRGKVLGGSTAINGMVVSRGNPNDYDHWASLGNSEWSYQHCLPYFKKIESCPEGDANYRGKSGPIGVRFFPQADMNPISQAWLTGGQQAGHPFNADMNAETPFGMAQMQSNCVDGQRQSTSYSYLRPIAKRSNLHIITGAQTTKVIIENCQAVGVEYHHKGKRCTAKANKEVLLSGGVINSPQLLQLSGIGDRADIEPHNIPVLHHLPGVGKNLKDHLAVSVKQRATKPYSLLSTLKPLAMIKAIIDYLLFKKGAAMVGPLEAWAHLKTSPELAQPDLQIYSVPLMYNDHGRDIIKEEGFMAVLNPCKPLSTGTVKIQSANPLEAPAIDPQYLSNKEDLRLMREGIKMIRNIFAQKAYDDFRGSEYGPGVGATSDDALDDYIRNQANSLYHPVGSCKMGRDKLAVVDQKLRVHGIQSLRVIDASVMPDIISGNTSLPTTMIAERAAEFILADA